MDDLLKNILNGDTRAIAKAISAIEHGGPAATAITNHIHPYTGGAHRIGITGAPGAGKSVLIDKMIQHYRNQDKRVAVLAIDPSSPLSGGALLADRLRMGDYAKDDKVFIRSMASRGSLGGLAQAANDSIDVLDAAKVDVILIETVGVGQSAVSIMHTADSTLVVLNPGGGDIIQAMKAGLMEIADIIVVNKSDLPNSDQTVSSVEASLSLLKPKDDWKIPIIKTVALTGDGIDALCESCQQHLDWLKQDNRLQNKHKQRVQARLQEATETTLKKMLWDQVNLEEACNHLTDGNATVESLIDKLINQFLKDMR